MAWTAPMTFAAASALTAAQMNAFVRDNMLETAPAKATTAGRIFVATGANAIAERAVSGATVATSQTTASTSFTDLATSGPAVTVTTGTQAMVFVAAQMSNATANAFSNMSFAVSGATTSAAAIGRAIEHIDTGGTAGQQISRTGAWTYIALTAGSNTFTAKYSVSAGTGTFVNRHLIVVAL